MFVTCGVTYYVSYWFPICKRKREHVLTIKKICSLFLWTLRTFTLYFREDVLIHGGSGGGFYSVYCFNDERLGIFLWNPRDCFCTHNGFEPSWKYPSPVVTSSETATSTQSCWLLGEKVEVVEANLAQLCYCFEIFNARRGIPEGSFSLHHRAERLGKSAHFSSLRAKIQTRSTR